MQMDDQFMPYQPEFSLAYGPEELGATFQNAITGCGQAGWRAGRQLDTTADNLVPRACAAAMSTLQGVLDGARAKPTHAVPTLQQHLDQLGYRMTMLLLTSQPVGVSQDHSQAGLAALATGIARALDEAIAAGEAEPAGGEAS